MIEEFKKTKALKLWFSMVVVFVVILNVSFVEAKSLKKGEEFKEKDGHGAIRVVSSDEVEFEGGSDIILGKYTIDGERVRIVVNAGTTMVRYYKIIPDGLKEEKGGKIYYSKAGEEKRQRAVEEKRKTALAAGARHFDNDNGTVTDNVTKLMWQQGEGGKMYRDIAIAYCKNLSLAGYNDWRLPNIKELKTIIGVGKEPAIDKTYFPTAYTKLYDSYYGTSDAWGVDFSSGLSDADSRTNPYYVRCVRSDGNAKSNDVQMDFIYAVANGKTEVVKMLLAKGADANAKDSNGNAGLIFAVEKKNPEIVKMLLDKGADVNAKNINGVPVLSWSAANGNPEIVKMLLAKGADVNAKNNDGNSALIFAANNMNTEIVKMLLDKGADANAKANNGRTALLLANDNIEIVKMLLAKGADVNAKDNNGNAVLIFAVVNKNIEIVKMLLEKGADVSMEESLGITVFDYTKDPKILEMLNNHAAQKK